MFQLDVYVLENNVNYVRKMFQEENFSWTEEKKRPSTTKFILSVSQRTNLVVLMGRLGFFSDFVQIHH